MAPLPTDIITYEICPKLPVKSLGRFKCVSKSFNTFISSSEFINLHLRRSLSPDAKRLLFLTGIDNSNIYSLDIDSPEHVTDIPLPRTLGKWLDGGVSIMGSINGLLCVELTLMMEVGFEFKHVLINPSIGVYREIPDNQGEFRVNFGSDITGFGFDSINDDYKLVRIAVNKSVQYGPTVLHFLGVDLHDNNKASVFSLKENKWKLADDKNGPTGALSARPGVLMKNHLLHWVFWSSNRYHICCFDVRTDKWAKDVPLMGLLLYGTDEYVKEDRDHKVVRHTYLGVLYDCLCVSTLTISSDIVWIMKAYGVKESWVKLFDIPFSKTGVWLFHSSATFGFCQRSKNKVLVRGNCNSGLIWLDIGSNTYEITKDTESVPRFRWACFCSESLVTIPGGQQIKSSTPLQKLILPPF